MFRRIGIVVLITVLSLVGAGCRKTKVQNPIADLDSKQPDKVLFDRSMDLMKRNKWDQARLTLQTLINTYPDSEYIARAKLAIGDAWYNEGGSAALAQAEVEYKDFITFFPNMPEAAEAQLKVAGIHYKQMEKPDRDYTHAKRAEDEYKELVRAYPDHPLVPEAKQRLREVQEVLGEREFRIGRFYYLRESYPAAIARLKSVVESYPLYSGADESLLMLGGSYEAQMELVRASQLPEGAKAKLLDELAAKAAEAYSRVVTRYPATESVGDAKSRLQALNRPVPEPTAEMLAQNKSEEESRGKLGKMGRVMLNFKKRPDMASAAKVGEPTMAEPVQTSAPAEVREFTERVQGAATNAVEVERVKDGDPLKSDPTPRSQPDPNEQPTAPPPAQVNEANAPQTPQATGTNNNSNQESSSRKKKKSGLRKLIPF